MLTHLRSIYLYPKMSWQTNCTLHLTITSTNLEMVPSVFTHSFKRTTTKCFSRLYAIPQKKASSKVGPKKKKQSCPVFLHLVTHRKKMPDKKYIVNRGFLRELFYKDPLHCNHPPFSNFALLPLFPFIFLTDDVIVPH